MAIAAGCSWPCRLVGIVPVYLEILPIVQQYLLTHRNIKKHGTNKPVWESSEISSLQSDRF